MGDSFVACYENVSYCYYTWKMLKVLVLPTGVERIVERVRASMACALTGLTTLLL